MRTLPVIAIVSGALLVYRGAIAGKPAAPVASAPASLELRDQFDAAQKLSFPATGTTLLTIAGRSGSDQIARWVTPLKQRFGKQLDIRGIAEVSSVPGPLRNMVRKRFQKLHVYPVMMDWEGIAGKLFAPVVPGKANILVLDSGGIVLARHSGEANAPAIQNLISVIEKEVAQSKTKAPAQ